MPAHQLDLDADFRTFYGLTPDDAEELTGPEYMALARRTVAYGGAVRQAAQEAAERDEEQGREIRDFRAPGVAEFFEVD